MSDQANIPNPKKDASARSSASKSTAKAASKSTARTNQREQILATASKLFHERGYNKTSLSEIARQIGLDQSSLYYWFPSKEAILESLYDANRSFPILERIREDVADRAVQLYMLIVYDVARKCELPFDFIELESLVHEHPEKYEGLLKSYRDFYQSVVEVITKGIEEGVFKECPVDEQAVTILSIDEGLQHHYHAKLRNELILTSCNYEVKEHSPEAIGHMAARTIIPGMLCEPQNMECIREKALREFEQLDLQEIVAGESSSKL